MFSKISVTASSNLLRNQSKFCCQASGHAIRRTKSSTVRPLTQYAPNDQIYLHPLENKIAVSFSRLPTSIPLGYSSSMTVTPQSFEPNPQFLPLLHSIIASNVDRDFAFIVEAGVNANTFMPVYDFREVPRFGRRPEIDNVFGYVQVDESGKIVPGSFEANEMYRICNASGLPRLSDHMYGQIQTALEQHS
ncbi:hypothetical protein EJF18_20645 [Clavispora lusitaniae]|uniref:Uncharacterized protein n=3 Tax=Clavispora lusitaniae TaxID=36911 RepID=C4Y0X3_CLAL4|nr:uncharacterized protein CLUG_01855 [Clavispora lusitaniae ATCC 42720]KAF7583318.1 hypothetical protein FOB63_001536 [Clavispora lusitaniae]EEQ37732.1 hypothetical protein CLUG_01855 [Clavispora lusitaniae ATCC 42720]QFZ26727.1 hypothetical protein EJF14_20645 [Clavispora lusitaniae]QFZ32395.1 hypothetical protein EJF16_20645 [Clavispora lusitaniae]QFZ38064.1 hypothetical protein EJF15_20645 [Clavispora lusitaniae]